MSTCRVCKEEFTPMQSFQTWCCVEHGVIIANLKLEKIRNSEKLKERRADKVKRESMKTRSDYIKEAQKEFNHYVRLRDAGKPCICCGAPLTAEAVGGGFDCGHYRSVGSAPHLRFDENNAHGQTKKCNRWGAGRAVDYRIGLIQRIGLSAVEALEADQEPRKYTIDDLKLLKSYYAAKAKELRAIE